MDWLQTLTAGGLPVTAAWVDDHNQVQASFTRELTPTEWQQFLALTNPAQARANAARSNAALVTTLKTVTAAQAAAWVQSIDLTNPATLKMVITIILQFEIALRDAQWPDMPDR